MQSTRTVLVLFSIFFIFLSSCGLFLNSPLGLKGTICYLFFLAVFFPLGVWGSRKIIFSQFTESNALRISVIIVLLMSSMLIFTIPMAIDGKLPGGATRNITLNLGVNEVLHGRYPYYAAISPREPMTPLGGSILLALPFVFLGQSGYQNALWLFIFIPICWYFLRDYRSVLMFFILLFVFAPVLLREFFNGSDFLANSIWIVFAVIIAEKINRFSTNGKILSSCANGILICSRFNFITLLPVFTVRVALSSGYKWAIRYFILTILVFFLLTIPFYLYDPNGYSPLHVSRFINRFNDIMPFASEIIKYSTAIIIILAAYFVWKQPKKILFWCALVLAVPNFFGLIFQSLLEKKISVGPYSNFLLPSLLLANLGLWQEMRLGRNNKPFLK